MEINANGIAQLDCLHNAYSSVCVAIRDYGGDSLMFLVLFLVLVYLQLALLGACISTLKDDDFKE